MNKKTGIIAAGIFLSLIILACGVSFGKSGLSEQDQLGTAVAQTVTANQQQPQQPTLEPPTQEPQAQPTNTVAPTDTQPAPPTQTPKPCNKAEFISETIADDTPMDPGESFTKTWRFKNTGTCTWNTNYKLVFSEGSKMDGPSSKNLNQSVAPGEQVDLSVDLEAPSENGTYKGIWKVQDDEGEFFIHNIWVQIKVSEPLTQKTITLSLDISEGGEAWSNGDVFATQYSMGDNVVNLDGQAFIAFDISGVPDNANILSVKADMSAYSLTGNPFGNLGCLRMYPQAYRPLDAGDYFGGSASGPVGRWCSKTDLEDVESHNGLDEALQDRVGKTYFPLRLQFNETETDHDNANDLVTFSDIELIVKYEY